MIPVKSMLNLIRKNTQMTLESQIFDEKALG